MRRLLIVVCLALAGCTEAPEQPIEPEAPQAPEWIEVTDEALFGWTFGIQTPVNGLILTPYEDGAVNPLQEAQLDATIEWSCLSVVCPMQVALMSGSKVIAEGSGDAPIMLTASNVTANSVELVMWPAQPAGVVIMADGVARITWSGFADTEEAEASGERST